MPSPAELFDLTGKVAVVTGGSRGIGRAVSFALAAAGAEVVVASRKLENCETTAAEITDATGTRAVPMAVNVSHWDQCGELVERVYAEFGHCDVLINNAGPVAALPRPHHGHRGALRQDPRGERQGARSGWPR